MKIGLALGSGSARGWSHIGIIEALAELDIHPEIVCGTSIGSIVGAAYATGNLGRLKQRVCALTKLNTASYFNFSMSIDGFVNKEKLRAFFADCVTPPGMLVEDLPVRYAYIYIGQLGFKHPCAALNAFNAVVQVINLSSAAYFLIYRVGYNA